MKPFCIALIFLTSLPLVLYPFVFLADVMTLAALPAARIPSVESFPIVAFTWSSLFYPIPYLIALVGSILTFKSKIQFAVLLQGGALSYLILVMIFFYIA